MGCGSLGPAPVGRNRITRARLLLTALCAVKRNHLGGMAAGVAFHPVARVAESSPVEAEIRRIGHELAEAFPSPARHPLRALDDRAMQLASQDAELRAALFRLVDVTPATRSLDDLARHLADYLDEVDERPPPLEAAMRMADSRAGRKALGAAAAAGVRHMAHRFIAGASPRDALGELRRLWEHGVA